MFTRLTFVLCVITGCLADRNIPKNLLFGAATASYQIEGAWNEDGKGVNIWDTFLHDADRENGDVACDSYHKWEEDIANAKALGLDLYRFSISWARILPNGTLNSVNQKGIDYYHNLIQGLLAVGIEPLVTIYHWDLPQHLSDLGGFLNPQLVDYFEDYARILYTEYGPYVKHWITINEPYSICAGGYGGGLIAPGLHLNGDGIYQCSYVLLKAHARAYRIYQEEFKSKYNGQIGISLVTNWYEPATDTTEDLEAQERAFQFIFGWFANPIFLGNWPQIMIDRIANRSALEGLARSRLPEFTQEEIDYINGTHDFFALNTYKVLDAFSTEHPISYPDYSFDMGASWDNLTFNPQGFRKLLNAINDRYHPDSIIITENGIVTEDITDDQERITYLRGYINALLDAIELDQINITGYTIWSLMDNFEWGSYDSKFGVIRVDFDSPDRTRTWKESAYWLQSVIADRTLDV